MIVWPAGPATLVRYQFGSSAFVCWLIVAQVAHRGKPTNWPLGLGSSWSCVRKSQAIGFPNAIEAMVLLSVGPCQAEEPGRPGKVASVAGSQLAEGPHHGSDETCNPTGKPSESRLLSQSDKFATRPGPTTAAERLRRSSRGPQKGLPASPFHWESTGRPPTRQPETRSRPGLRSGDAIAWAA